VTTLTGGEQDGSQPERAPAGEIDQAEVAELRQEVVLLRTIIAMVLGACKLAGGPAVGDR
jgi:hypothetical protein